jgi:hypothetical protein
MVAPIYSNKKGIYKNLYSQIDSDNKKTKAETCSNRRPKGIYRDLYQHILGFEGKETNNNAKENMNIIQSVQRTIRLYFSKMSYFFSSASSSLKMLILACLIVIKPVNNYIENNIVGQEYPTYN